MTNESLQIQLMAAVRQTRSIVESWIPSNAQLPSMPSQSADSRTAAMQSNFRVLRLGVGAKPDYSKNGTRYNNNTDNEVGVSNSASASKLQRHLAKSSKSAAEIAGKPDKQIDVDKAEVEEESKSKLISAATSSSSSSSSSSANKKKRPTGGGDILTMWKKDKKKKG